MGIIMADGGMAYEPGPSEALPDIPWMRLSLKTVPQLEAEVDEVATITAATDFLASELGVDSVQVWTAGEGDNVGDKARFAFPLEPGIAYQ